MNIGYESNASFEALRESLKDGDTSSLLPEMVEGLYAGKAVPIVQSRGMIRLNLADFIHDAMNDAVAADISLFATGSMTENTLKKELKEAVQNRCELFTDEYAEALRQGYSI